MTDPIDQTQPHPDAAGPQPATPATPDAARPAANTGDGRPPDTGDGRPPAEPATAAPIGSPRLRVDPDRQSDPGWREPAWYPPRSGRDERDRRSGTLAIIAGLILIAIGVWYFLDYTLGLDLPTIRWGGLWPLIVIAVGAVILVRSMQRRS